MLCVWHFGASDQWASVLSKLAKQMPVTWKRHPLKVIPRQNICSQFLIMIVGKKWGNDIKQQTVLVFVKHQENYSETELTKSFHLASWRDHVPAIVLNHPNATQSKSEKEKGNGKQ